MQDQKKHFRHILFFYYRKDKNVVQTRKKSMEKTYWQYCINHQCQNKSFHPNNFDIKDAPRSDEDQLNEEKIKALIEANQGITTRKIATRLNLSNSIVRNHSIVKRHNVLLSWKKNEITFRTIRNIFRANGPRLKKF